MPSPLHKTPLGLLELFRLKTLGRAPEFFGDTVIPTVDVLEAYGAAELQSANSGPSAPGAINGAAGLFNQIAIANFQWVWSVAGNLVLGAAPGTFITWTCSIVVGTGASVAVSNGELRTVVAGQSITFGLALPRPMVLRAGSVLVVRCNGDAVGADHTLECRVLHVPAANLT